MKTIKHFLLPLLCCWGVFAPLLAIIIFFNSFIGIFLNLFLGIAIFFVFSQWFKKRSINQRELIVHYLILFSPMVAFTIFYLWRGPDSYRTSINFVLAPVLGCVAGVLYSHLKLLKVRVVIIGFTAVIVGWVYVTGLKQWANYWNFTFYYDKYSIRTGEISEPTPHFIFTGDSAILTNANLLGKTVIVDFWGRTCGPCFRAIPTFIELKNKFKSKKDVVFLLVNIPYKTETLSQAKATLKNAGFGIDTYLGPETKISFDELKIASLPATWIINKKGKLIYRGSIEGVESIISKSLD